MYYIALNVTTLQYLSSLAVLAMKSRSHADYVTSHAFQLKQIVRN